MLVDSQRSSEWFPSKTQQTSWTPVVAVGTRSVVGGSERNANLAEGQEIRRLLPGAFQTERLTFLE